jgi:hypothetical protein
LYVATKRKTSSKTGRTQRGAVALNTPIEPSSLHAITVVGAVVIGGVVVLAVAFAASHM